MGRRGYNTYTVYHPGSLETWEVGHRLWVWVFFVFVLFLQVTYCTHCFIFKETSPKKPPKVEEKPTVYYSLKILTYYDENEFI